ncbi:MAG: hypothetical protein QXD69_01615 [Candidatus Bathyarchaeia archaeon]
MSSTKLKEEFLKLLETDREFRYLVISHLGLIELIEGQRKILEELKILHENQEKLWENANKLWEEVKSLREGQEKLWMEVRLLREEQEKLWQEVKNLREGQNKLWEEVKSLREGQEKLWENQNKLWMEVRSLREGQEKLWMEVKSLREGQEKLWENQNKLWEEVKSLREGQAKLWENANRLWEEVKHLREGQNRLWENQNRLWKSQERMRDEFRSWTIQGFGELAKFAGVSFEEFVRSFLTKHLREMGLIPADGELKKTVIDGEEINIFFENPLIIGEVTSSVESIKELEKLLKRAELAREKYGREPVKYLIALTASASIADEIKERAKINNVELILGKIS